MKTYEYTPIERTDKLLFICPLCKKPFKALAYHTTQAHGITGKELRKRHGLKATYQLITPCLKERHRNIALEGNMHERLPSLGQRTRFTKGHRGHTKDTWSAEALSEMSKRQSKQ